MSAKHDPRKKMIHCPCGACRIMTSWLDREAKAFEKRQQSPRTANKAFTGPWQKKAKKGGAQ